MSLRPRELVIDLFAGPRGWDEGARLVGVEGVIGIEHDLSACQTSVAAGHPVIRADVSRYPVEPFKGKVHGLIASPPCPGFSTAGKRDGISDVPRIIQHAQSLLTGWRDYDREGWADPRSHLTLEPLRWALQLVPDWIACEQVPDVLPIWECYARTLHAHGWLTWCGILNAADYGVPQTRRRAFLLAHRKFQPQAPAPTHAQYPAPVLFGDELKPWVSMASALGWGATDCASPVVTSGGTRTGGAEPFGNGARSSLLRERERTVVMTRGDRKTEGGNEFDADQPSWALTEKARSWVVQTGNNSHVTSREGSRAGEGGVELYEPAPTLDAKAGAAWRVLHTNRGQDKNGNRQTRPAPAPALSTKAGGQWWWEQPSTTLGGDPRVSPRCHHDEGMQGRDALAAAAAAAGEGTGIEPIRLTVRDALILQSFPPDYPVQGTRTKQFEQIGNAVPPLLAAHVLAQLLEAIERVP